MGGILKSKVLGGKKGKSLLAMLQEKMFEKREECLNVNRVLCCVVLEIGNGNSIWSQEEKIRFWWTL